MVSRPLKNDIKHKTYIVIDHESSISTHLSKEKMIK